MSGLEQRLGIAAALATAAVTWVQEMAGRPNARPEGKSFISKTLTLLSEPGHEETKV